jgi:16S rRNA (adenine1518-N6/adenine1519-N6)-dimethyltransferase
MTLNYNSSSELKAFLEQQGLGMQKKFGQNFLVDANVKNILVEALNLQAGDEVWEIGPGLGAVTALMLEKNFKVKAFEIDKGFIRVLKELFGGDENFNLAEGDVMKTWKDHAVSRPAPRYLFGNLPYNIAAALLADFIEEGLIFSRVVVTVQKEVALRMTAKAGSKDYSSFSVMCANVYRLKPLITIRPSSFYPQPNVDSMGVLLESKEPCSNSYLTTGERSGGCFYRLVRALFASRRKTIKNNLMAFVNSKEICEAVLRENGLSGNERAETLEVDTFLSLAKSVDNMRLYKKEC